VYYLDCPSTVTVSPSSGPFKAGDELTCGSDGDPELRYEWTSHDEVVATGRTVTLTAGWFEFVCRVYGHPTKYCYEKKVISGTVVGKRTLLFICPMDIAMSAVTSLFLPYLLSL